MSEHIYAIRKWLIHKIAGETISVAIAIESTETSLRVLRKHACMDRVKAHGYWFPSPSTTTIFSTLEGLLNEGVPDHDKQKP